MRDPFQGVYQLNSFDLLLLIPYFTLLSILAFYGLHRYFLVYTYWRYRQNRPVPPAREWAVWPRVTIQLPLYNERYVAERLIEEVCRLDYPRELLEIQVLDDSTDETVTVARHCVERYAALGYPVGYSDHSVGTAMNFAAIALGADFIEKTITANRDTAAVEHYMSLEPHELKDFVKQVRAVSVSRATRRK